MSTMYCSACGEDVETFKMLQAHYDPPVEEVCCTHCGMTIGEDDGNKTTSAGNILIAEDSPMLREMLKDLLETERLAEEVIPCEHGVKMITSATEMVIDKKPLTLMILDISMPILNGINAAIAFRGVEAAFKVDRTPIVFFTGHKCDDNLKKILQHCRPALYINKGAVSRPDELAGRIRRVIQRVMQMKDKMGKHGTGSSERAQ